MHVAIIRTLSNYRPKKKQPFVFLPCDQLLLFDVKNKEKNNANSFICVLNGVNIYIESRVFIQSIFMGE